MFFIDNGEKGENMKINKRILNLSTWLALITLLLIPGKFQTEGVQRIEFGFPIRFFTTYHNETNESLWFASTVSIKLLYFFINILIIYVVIHVILQIKNKMKTSKEKWD